MPTTTRTRRWWYVALVCCGTATACGSDDEDAPPAASGAAAGRAGSAGATSEAGAENAGGVPPGGSTGTAGLSSEAGAAGEANQAGGSGAEGGSAGAGGASAQGGSAGVVGAGGELTTPLGAWPDSATTICFDVDSVAACPSDQEPLFGQDGNYEINVPTYVVTDDTIQCSVTGLTWERNASNAEVDHATAQAYCAALTLAGENDWRLPTRLEYISLLDLGRQSIPLNVVPEPLDSIGAAWTSSPANANFPAGYFWQADETSGIVPVSDNDAAVRCVRGSGLSGSFQVGAASVVHTLTELEWQLGDIPATEMSWDEALAHCEALTHDQKSDWRLPTIKELGTVVDEQQTVYPAVDPDVFGVMTSSSYWSSTMNNAITPRPRTLSLGAGGLSYPVAADFTALAWCVRTAD